MRRSKAAGEMHALSAAAVLAFVAFWAGTVRAQPDPPAAAFDAIGARTMASGDAAGLAWAVVHRGRVVYERGLGVADVASGTPVTPNTRFAIGSLTKQFTAVAILTLRDARKLSLDDPLARYLPQLPNAKSITLRMLLNQTSGLHNYPLTTEHPWPLHGAIPPERIFAFLATDSSDFPPGTRWAYSNANYAALAGVVARASE